MTEFSCFHITTEDRLISILKCGLRPNSVANRSARKAPHIMLSLYPAWSLYKNYKKKSHLILIEIRDPAIKQEMFLDDPEGLAWEQTINPEYFRGVARFEVLT